MEEEQTERQAPEGAGSGKQKKAGKRRVFGKKGGQKREKGALTAAFEEYTARSARREERRNTRRERRRETRTLTRPNAHRGLER